jgi:DNA-directed RNA polymerase specialized sigma subunit
MMTLKELSQLYYLNREIELDQEHLEELRAKAENATAAPITDMPKGSTIESKLERYVAEIVDLTAIITAKQMQCIHERNRLMRYIDCIPSSRTRMMFTLRFVNGLTWAQVAEHIGGPLTEAYVRNACYKHIKTFQAKK